jgi:hypothetical protein
MRQYMKLLRPGIKRLNTLINLTVKRSLDSLAVSKVLHVTFLHKWHNDERSVISLATGKLTCRSPRHFQAHLNLLR